MVFLLNTLSGRVCAALCSFSTRGRGRLLPPQGRVLLSRALFLKHRGAFDPEHILRQLLRLVLCISLGVEAVHQVMRVNM